MNALAHRYLLGLFVKTGGVFSKPLLGGMGHILCFHRVMEPEDRERINANAGMEISPGKLLWIIRHFTTQGYEVISLRNLYERLTGQTKSNRRFIVITLDDGYADNFTVAFPLLTRAEYPFAVFVTTDFPEGKAIMWWYFLENFILEHSEIVWRGVDETLILASRTKEQKEDAFHKIRRQLIDCEEQNLIHLLQINLGLSYEEIKAFCLRNSMQWHEVATLAKHPLATVGAHTHTHRALKSLGTLRAMDEMKGSAKMISEKTGVEVTHFAYPFGSSLEVGDECIRLASETGFETALTLEQGNVFPAHSRHLLRLPRIPLGERNSAADLNNIISGVRHFSFNGFRKIL